jgi:phage/plasmid-like protein (TIGR03299 family)
MHEVENMMSVGVVPWHGLGVILDKPPATIEEAVVCAGLSWRVGLKELSFTPTGDWLDHVTTDHFAVVREVSGCAGNVLGVVGPGYHPIQNVDAFKFFNPALEKGLVTIESGGSLRNGKRVWMLAKITGVEADVVKGDAVNGYFLLSSSHDGTLAIRVGFTKVRVVCQNTLSAAHQGDGLIRVRHTKNVENMLAVIQNSVDYTRQEFTKSIADMKSLVRVQMNSNSLRTYVQDVFSPEITTRTNDGEARKKALNKMYDKVVPFFESGRGSDIKGVRGTAWAAYNSVTEYLSWSAGRSKDTRIESLWFGKNGEIANRAFETALSFAA